MQRFVWRGMLPPLRAAVRLHGAVRASCQVCAALQRVVLRLEVRLVRHDVPPPLLHCAALDLPDFIAHLRGEQTLNLFELLDWLLLSFPFLHTCAGRGALLTSQAVASIAVVSRRTSGHY
jgi:hypothetical protein